MYRFILILVHQLKKLVLHNPLILELDTNVAEESTLVQYTIDCKEDDKFLLLFALIKLKLIRGKTIIFVNGVDRCFRVKLFLGLYLPLY